MAIFWDELKEYTADEAVRLQRLFQEQGERLIRRAVLEQRAAIMEEPGPTLSRRRGYLLGTACQPEVLNNLVNFQIRNKQ